MSTIRMTAFALLSCLPLLGCSDRNNAHVDVRADGQPKAHITPAGEFVVDGKPVVVDEGQKALLLEYRKRVIGVSDAAIAAGMGGADLASKALDVAVKGGFGKDAGHIDKKIETGVEDIEQSAKQVCGMLPALKAAQDDLAAVLPEFKPYATLTQSNVDGCVSDFGAGGTGKAVAAATNNGTAEAASSFAEGLSSGYHRSKTAHESKIGDPPAEKSDAASEKQ